ncbi:MAG: acetate kinase, partial [Deltaproteobacteria bacterium]|nr:acetate kinase [Deltaproteobacteria bacterium]
DILVFTAGVGENSATMRAAICQGLEGIGLELDADKNAVRSPEPRVVSSASSKIKIHVIPTNEELAIADATVKLAG